MDLGQKYINNNPGNVKLLVEGYLLDSLPNVSDEVLAKEGYILGRDYYRGKETNIPYRKFKTKKEGLKAILDIVSGYDAKDLNTVLSNYKSDDLSGIAAKNQDYLSMLSENTKGKLGAADDIVNLKDKDIAYGFLKSMVRMENDPDAMDYYTDKDIKAVANQYSMKKDIMVEELRDVPKADENLVDTSYIKQ
jgi:hypothetical protein